MQEFWSKYKRSSSKTQCLKNTNLCILLGIYLRTYFVRGWLIFDKFENKRDKFSKLNFNLVFLVL